MSNQPTEQPQSRMNATTNAGSKTRWNTPELWAFIATVLVVLPVTTFASGAAVDAGVPAWASAAVAAVISATSFALLGTGTGRARDGVLSGVWLLFLLIAVEDTAKALDVSETLITLAYMVPISAALMWRYHRDGRKNDPA